jgi:hypothetical protein
MPNINPNSTDYIHSFEPDINDLVEAMDYNQSGEPILRTLLGFSDSTNLSAFSILRVANTREKI